MRQEPGAVVSAGLALRAAPGARGTTVVWPMAETRKLEARAAQSEFLHSIALFMFRSIGSVQMGVRCIVVLLRYKQITSV